MKVHNAWPKSMFEFIKKSTQNSSLCHMVDFGITKGTITSRWNLMA
jgi:hypothetical protein